MRVIFLIVSLLSFHTLAHMQGPRELNQVVYSQFPQVELTLGNLYDIDKVYSLEVNGYLVEEAIRLKGNQVTKQLIQLPKVEPNKVNRFRVCSMTAATQEVRSKICSRVNVYYPQR
ncbi:hypothetical protein MHN79_14915 [Vibrio sp. Of14-4]|uniref:hypothetical protein n=1 Tax=Vibrio sp. Of14-4 TaxID=2724878 RepID=UPI001EF20799|nr:hypothetical protein [Vibrio sp. Of14-4]MCG7490782.1 hypothetical protein [Vibrio sp. Of14-4]